MKASIIIINYNTFSLTANCIESVLRHTQGVDFEIILVDNASTECDPDLFLERFPGILLIKSERNGGFAYGNNLGIGRASGDYILLLNSDTVLKEDSISSSVGFCSMSNAGVVGCRMIYPDGRVQYSARRFRSISWELLDFFRFIPILMPYRKRARKMLGKYFRHDENIEADWVNGAFFLFPRLILEKLPGKKLDNRFFMYGEDQLWCEQIKKLGYKIYFYAETTIVHINSGSTDLSRQLKLRNTMLKHELSIMRERKGIGLYYQFFKLLYTLKESGRNFIKFVVFRTTGRLLR
jgi:GT2 family glycosyltransferase